MDETQTILLVDDSDDDLSQIKKACEVARFKATLRTVVGGREALAYLDGHGIYADREKYPLPAVMLLDLNMPMVDGFDVLRQIRGRAESRHVWVFVLTGSALPQDVQSAFELGVHAYLVKPSNLPALIDMISCMRDWLDFNWFPPPKRSLPETNSNSTSCPGEVQAYPNAPFCKAPA